MKNFMKILSVSLIVLLAAATFAACGAPKDIDATETENETQPKEDHVHLPGDEVFADKDNHWYRCYEDDEICNLAEHTIVDDICNECGVGIVDFGDEGKVLTFYDKNNQWIRKVTYKPDGTTSEETSENTYDSNNRLTSMKIYADGKLTKEFVINEDDTSTETIYNEDGTKTCIENTELGFAKTEIVYDASGAKISEMIAEFDENNFEIGRKYYEGDKLVKEEKKFIVSSDSWGGKVYHTEVTTYNADGTTTVATYNENNELIEK